MFQPDADTRPTQLTVFELKAFVNNELNTTIFAACTWEHNRREMHRYNLNKSIHCVNNIDERRSDQSEKQFFCQKYSQAKIHLIVTRTSLREKKKTGFSREYFLTKYFNLTYFVLMVGFNTYMHYAV